MNAGFDSVVFDLSTLPLEENAQSTKQAVEAFKSINPAHPRSLARKGGAAAAVEAKLVSRNTGDVVSRSCS